MSDKSMGYTELGSMRFHQEPQKRLGVTGDVIKKWVVRAGIAAAVVLVVFGIAKLTGSGKYEAAIKDYVKFVNDSVNGKGKGNKLMNNYPSFMAETIEERCDDFEHLLVREMGGGEDYNFTCKYKVISKEKLDGEELKEYQDDITTFAGEEENVKVKSGYLFEVELTLEVRAEGTGEKGEYSQSQNIEMVVLKCNGKIGLWKMEENYIWRM